MLNTTNTDTHAEMIELVERIATCATNLGLAEGWREAAALARHQSGEAFARGDDRAAQTLRQFANTLADKAKSLRQRYDTEFAPIQQAAFRQLEALPIPPTPVDGDELCEHGFSRHCPENCN